jgi:mono/diheme cytochrome c family protein
MKSKIAIFIIVITMSGWQSDELSKSISKGKEVYMEYCMLCHKVDGAGKKDMIPPLANADWIKNNRAKTIHAVKYGMKGPIVVNGSTYNSMMASQSLSDEEVADVVNYIFHSWGNNYGKIVTDSEVSKISK